MKRTFSFFLFGLLSVPSFSQLKIDLVLHPTPPANLTEWAGRREVLTAVITGQPGLALQVKVKSEIKTTDGTVIGTTDLARAPIFNISSGVATLFTATEVLPMEFMVFNGRYRSSLDRTGKLPSDNYTLCVQLVRPVDYAPLSLPVNCKNFYLAATQLPILMKPFNEEVLDAQKAQTAITFRWTPVVPRTTATVTYRIQVFEVLPEQTPLQALRSNQPLLDQQITGTTQYIWRPQMSFMAYYQEGQNQGSMPDHPGKALINQGGATSNAGGRHIHTFIWTIQSLDAQGLPVTQTDGNGEARSEPIVFYVADSPGIKGKEKGNR
jgi:hypothetical protein